jgi:drug/metabolite transporter superfamily protein YnfA
MTETGGSARRPIAGLAVGLVALLVLGYPIVVTALLANVSFTGCFLECSAPRPGRGVAWSAVTAVLLAVPAFLGLAVARARSRRARLSAGAVVVALVVAWGLLSVLG